MILNFQYPEKSLREEEGEEKKGEEVRGKKEKIEGANVDGETCSPMDIEALPPPPILDPIFAILPDLLTALETAVDFDSSIDSKREEQTTTVEVVGVIISSLE